MYFYSKYGAPVQAFPRQWTEALLKDEFGTMTLNCSLYTEEKLWICHITSFNNFMSHISFVWHCHICQYKSNTILNIYIYGIHKGIPNTLESFPHSYMQSRNFGALGAICNSLYHNLFFVGSLLQSQSAFIKASNYRLLLMPCSGKKTLTGHKQYFTWHLGGLRPRVYRKGYRKTLCLIT